MKVFGLIIALAGIVGVIVPFMKIFLKKQTEKEMHTELFALMLLLFIGLPALGFVAKFLFANELAVSVFVILGLIGINICVFKNKL